MLLVPVNCNLTLAWSAGNHAPRVCRLQLALACKALLADYGRQPAAWLEDLEVRFQPGSEEALASQRSQLVSLLQRASSAQLQGQGEPAAAVQPLPFGVQYLFLFQEPAVRARQLLELAVMLAPRLHMLDVRLKTQSSLEHEPGGQNGAHLGGVRLAGHFPCLTWLRAWLGSRRHGQSDQPCVLEIEAPRLECLMLRRGVLRQLFPALTHLDLYDVRLEEPAASNMLAGGRRPASCLALPDVRTFQAPLSAPIQAEAPKASHTLLLPAATGLRALHLVRVDTPAAMPWSNLSQLAELTSLKLCHTVPYEPVVQTLATLRSLRRLELVDIQEEAIADVVAQVSDQLTELVLKVAPTFPVAPRVCDTQRLTNLRSIVLSSDGDNAADFYPSLHTIANVVLI